jgi:hypothetical protein
MLQLIISCLFFLEALSDYVVSDLRTYPGKSDSITDGSVTLSWIGTTVTLTWTGLVGYDSLCDNGPSTSANSCGIHIHAGKTCATHNLIGGHYWDSDALNSDPWSDVVIDGADGSVSVDFGYTEDESKYRAFVIHDHNGDRATCNTLGADAVRTLTTVGSFPGYTGGVSIEGSVQIAFKGTIVEMTYDLSGVEAECATPDAGTPNSCGIHIHSGTSCLDGGAVGIHYWDSGVDATDPWTSTYTGASGVVEVDNYYDYTANIGRAFIIHDYAGVTRDPLNNYTTPSKKRCLLNSLLFHR